MRKLLRGAYNKKYLDYVCVDAIGDILTPKYISSHFKVILAKNGLKQIRFHDLRHSCASLLLSSGADIKSVQEILGHADASTTLNFYVKTDLKQMRSATEKYAKAFGL
jgi:site-specific recombinase XerD